MQDINTKAVEFQDQDSGVTKPNKTRVTKATHDIGSRVVIPRLKVSEVQRFRQSNEVQDSKRLILF